MKPVRYSNTWKTSPHAAYIPGTILSVIVITLCLISGSAWSFETIQGHVDNPPVHENATKGFSTSLPDPSPTMADSCLPLLKSIRHNTPPSAMDRNQRSAGKAAALGLVLGVRFALTPPSVTKSKSPEPRFDVWQPVTDISGDGSANDRSALAVSAYRQCQKEQALKALNDFRWKR